jgi:hypothetical protein
MSRPEVIGDTSESNIHAANANVLQNQGNIAAAIEEYLAAISDCEANGQPAKHRYHLNLANCYRFQATQQPDVRDNLLAAAEAHMLRALFLAEGNPLGQMEVLLSRAALVATEIDAQEILEELKEAETVLPSLVRQMHERGARYRKKPALLTLAEFALRDRFLTKSKNGQTREIPYPIARPLVAGGQPEVETTDAWELPSPSAAVTVTNAPVIDLEHWRTPKQDGWEITEDTFPTAVLPNPQPEDIVVPSRRRVAKRRLLGPQNLGAEI